MQSAQHCQVITATDFEKGRYLCHARSTAISMKIGNHIYACWDES
jgi:hypothetical protein